MQKRGFTLIELAIVIVIAGILAAIAVPIYQTLVEDSKWKEGEAAIGLISTAVDVYRVRMSGYTGLATGAADTAATATTNWFNVLELDANEFNTLKYFNATEFNLVTIPATADSNAYVIEIQEPATGAKSGRPLGSLRYNGSTKIFTKF